MPSAVDLLSSPNASTPPAPNDGISAASALGSMIRRSRGENVPPPAPVIPPAAPVPPPRTERTATPPAPPASESKAPAPVAPKAPEGDKPPAAKEAPTPPKRFEFSPDALGEHYPGGTAEKPEGDKPPAAAAPTGAAAAAEEEDEKPPERPNSKDFNSTWARMRRAEKALKALEKNPPAATGSPSSAKEPEEVKLVKAQLEERTKAYEELEREVFAGRVQASPEWKKSVLEPASALEKTIEEIAISHIRRNADPDATAEQREAQARQFMARLDQAASTDDPIQRRQLVNDLTEDMGRGDEADFREAVKQTQAVRAKAAELSKLSKEAAAALSQRDSQVSEKTTAERRAAIANAHDSVSRQMATGFEFIRDPAQFARMPAKFREDFSAAEKMAREFDFSAAAPEEIAALAQHAFKFRPLMQVANAFSQAQAKHIAYLEGILADRAAGSPEIGASDAPLPSGDGASEGGFARTVGAAIRRRNG